MNKNIKLSMLLLAFAVIVAFVGGVDAQSGIITKSGSTGFKPVTTQSLTVATASASIIGIMPTDCRTITVIASGATMYYGDANVTTTGLYPCITDGNSVTFDEISTRNPTIYFRALSTATAKIGIIAR